MDYLKKYNITAEEIEEIKDRYNEGIINFMTQEKDFIIQKLEYLKEKQYMIMPILLNNIKIFLEEMRPLKQKVKKMEEKGYSKKSMQMVLMNEHMYDNI